MKTAKKIITILGYILFGSLFTLKAQTNNVNSIPPEIRKIVSTRAINKITFRYLKLLNGIANSDINSDQDDYITASYSLKNEGRIFLDSTIFIKDNINPDLNILSYRVKDYLTQFKVFYVPHPSQKISFRNAKTSAIYSKQGSYFIDVYYICVLPGRYAKENTPLNSLPKYENHLRVAKLKVENLLDKKKLKAYIIDILDADTIHSPQPQIDISLNPISLGNNPQTKPLGQGPKKELDLGEIPRNQSIIVPYEIEGSDLDTTPVYIKSQFPFLISLGDNDSYTTIKQIKPDASGKLKKTTIFLKYAPRQLGELANIKKDQNILKVVTHSHFLIEEKLYVKAILKVPSVYPTQSSFNRPSDKKGSKEIFRVPIIGDSYSDKDTLKIMIPDEEGVSINGQTQGVYKIIPINGRIMDTVDIEIKRPPSGLVDLDIKIVADPTEKNIHISRPYRPFIAVNASMPLVFNTNSNQLQFQPRLIRPNLSFFRHPFGVFIGGFENKNDPEPLKSYTQVELENAEIAAGNTSSFIESRHNHFAFRFGAYISPPKPEGVKEYAYEKKFKLYLMAGLSVINGYTWDVHEGDFSELLNPIPPSTDRYAIHYREVNSVNFLIGGICQF